MPIIISQAEKSSGRKTQKYLSIIGGIIIAISTTPDIILYLNHTLKVSSEAITFGNNIPAYLYLDPIIGSLIVIVGYINKRWLYLINLLLCACILIAAGYDLFGYIADINATSNKVLYLTTSIFLLGGILAIIGGLIGVISKRKRLFM